MKRSESLSWPTVVIERRFSRLNPTPEYQRDSVWSKAQKQLLIDSIIRNMDIPKLYFRQVDGQSEFDYEIIDGQQRIRAIYEFRKGEFSLSSKFTPDFGNKYYEQLPESVKDIIDLYQVSITVIDDATDEEIRDMFFRLQNGKPLNAAEKRNAVGGGMRDFISDLVATHAVFEAYPRNNQRFSYEQMAAQCVLLELTGSIIDVKNSNLDRMYKSRADFSHDGSEAKRIKRVMSYLARAFSQPTPEFSGRAQFVSLYWLVSRTIDDYAMYGMESKLREFFIDFESRRQMYDNEEIEFVRYSEALSRTSDGRERIEYRHDMLLREWLLFVPDLAKKDNVRSFSHEQRIAIYRRDNGICQICGDPVPLEEFEADHIVPHSKGGLTVVANGQASHKVCNASKGNQPL